MEQEDFGVEWAKDLAAADVAPIREIVGGIFPEGVTLLAGKPKQGKSRFMFQIAHAVTSEVPALGRPVIPGRVLYLAFEESRQLLHKKLAEMFPDDKIPQRLGIVSAERGWPRADRGGIDQIRRFMDRYQDTVMVVMDTLGYVRRPLDKKYGSFYDQDREAILPWARLARERHVAIALVHHLTKKEDPDAFAQMGGTNGLTGTADNLAVLIREPKTDRATLVVGGRVIEGGTYHLTFDKRGIWVPSSAGERPTPLTEEERVRRVVCEEGAEVMTAESVARVLGLDPKNVAAYLSRLRDRGDIVRVKRGQYTRPRRDAA